MSTNESVNEDTIIRTEPTPEWEDRILSAGNGLLDMVGLARKGWRMEFTDDDDYAGATFPAYRVILLTRLLLQGVDVRNVEETLLHEAAHAIAERDHDPVWFDTLLNLGGTGMWIRDDGTLSPLAVLPEPSKALKEMELS